MLNCLFLTASIFLTFDNNIVNFAAVVILEFSFNAYINSLVMFTVSFLLSTRLSRCDGLWQNFSTGPLLCMLLTRK